MRPPAMLPVAREARDTHPSSASTQHRVPLCHPRVVALPGANHPAGPTAAPLPVLLVPPLRIRAPPRAPEEDLEAADAFDARHQKLSKAALAALYSLHHGGASPRQWGQWEEAAGELQRNRYFAPRDTRLGEGMSAIAAAQKARARARQREWRLDESIWREHSIA